MKLLVLQHIEIETPGLFELLLKERGIEIDFIHGYRGDAYPESIESYSGFIVMGGPMGVYEESAYPFLKAEKFYLEKVLQTEKPVLGVCLGSQLLASVLGAEVKKGLQKEIGWYEVALTEEGKQDPLLKEAPTQFTPLHWHGDVFDLPKGAVSLASSQLTQHQAFRYRKNVYGFLFHMEVTEIMLPIWIDRFAEELKEAHLNGPQILRQAQDLMPKVHSMAQPLFSNWFNLL